MFLTAWMLREVSPQLSGNYYVFSGVGNYPRRHSPTRTDTRKGLRVRINRAIRANIMEARNPTYDNSVDGHASEPPNAAPDPTKRLDIPLIASERVIKTKPEMPPDRDQVLTPTLVKPKQPDQVLIPTSWRNQQRYRSQMHRTPTYRLNETNYSQIAALTELGELILNKHQPLEDLVRLEIRNSWVNLSGFLQKQHRDLQSFYKSGIERLGKAMEKDSPTRRTACALYLASSLVRLWPPSWVTRCTKAINTFKPMSPPGNSKSHIDPVRFRNNSTFRNE